MGANQENAHLTFASQIFMFHTWLHRKVQTRTLMVTAARRWYFPFALPKPRVHFLHSCILRTANTFLHFGHWTLSLLDCVRAVEGLSTNTYDQLPGLRQQASLLSLVTRSFSDLVAIILETLMGVCATATKFGGRRGRLLKFTSVSHASGSVHHLSPSLMTAR